MHQSASADRPDWASAQGKDAQFRRRRALRVRYASYEGPRKVHRCLHTWPWTRLWCLESIRRLNTAHSTLPAASSDCLNCSSEWDESATFHLRQALRLSYASWKVHRCLHTWPWSRLWCLESIFYLKLAISVFLFYFFYFQALLYLHCMQQFCCFCVVCLCSSPTPKCNCERPGSISRLCVMKEIKGKEKNVLKSNWCGYSHWFIWHKKCPLPFCLSSRHSRYDRNMRTYLLGF